MNSNIDAKLLAKMFLVGAKSLEAKKEWINELNVFPVPDGDTGTNMTLTIMSAVKEVTAIPEEKMNMEVLSKAISSGSLRGARGNSGVILSQLLRGLCKEIKTVDTIDTELVASAFARAVETAYKAVMKPKEGTILTVAKGMSDKATEMAKSGADMTELLTEVLEYGKVVLSKTPEMLPVLKQAGVVDSGGQGLIVAFSGAVDCFLGKEVDLDFSETSVAPAADSSTVAPKGKDEIETADIKFGYCTEFIIMLEKEFTLDDEIKFKEFLSSIGDSIVCVADDEIVKVHVHTNHPGQAFEKGLEYGSLTRMKVDNMREEHNERVIKDAEKLAAEQKKQEEEKKAEEPRKAYGFISVAAGKGLADIFRELGVDYVIEGGQTMNPSTEDMLNAISSINADNIFILPNNSNIIMAARQAKDLVEDKNIIVVPSKTIPQGITAMINFAPEGSVEENESAMTESLSAVSTGSITYAIRDTSMDGFEIKKNDIMCVGDKGIIAIGADISDTTVDSVKKMVENNEDSELISLYYGEGISEDDAEEVRAQLEKLFPEMDINVQEGAQPVYYYIVSVE